MCVEGGQGALNKRVVKDVGRRAKMRTKKKSGRRDRRRGRAHPPRQSSASGAAPPRTARSLIYWCACVCVCARAHRTRLILCSLLGDRLLVLVGDPPHTVVVPSSSSSWETEQNREDFSKPLRSQSFKPPRLHLRRGGASGALCPLPRSIVRRSGGGGSVRPEQRVLRPVLSASN